MASHVIEHVADLGHYLDALTGLLCPGGALFVEVPHCVPPQYYAVRDGDEPHTFFLTAAALRALAMRLGLEVTEIQAFGPDVATYQADKRLLRDHRRNQNGIFLRALLQRPATA